MRAFGRSKLMCLSLALLAGHLGTVSVSAASAVVDARRLVFNVSTDDSAVDANGNAIVERYALQIFHAGQPTLVHSVSLGKPTPDPGGTVRLPLLPLLYAPLAPNVFYEAVVQAVGPFGTSDSERSNSFIFTPPPCDPWFSPDSMVYTTAGGPSATFVNAAAGCSWTATSKAAWLTITAGAAGSGNGTVEFIVTPNGDKNTRHGTLTVAGSTFRARQEGDKDKDRQNKHKDDQASGKAAGKNSGKATDSGMGHGHNGKAKDSGKTTDKGKGGKRRDVP